MPDLFGLPPSDDHNISFLGVLKSESENFEAVDRKSENSIVDSEIFIRKAFETDVALGCKLLFQIYYKALCNHAVRIVYSREVSEDIVADVFCSFWDHKAYEQINRSYRAYLVTATRNRCFNYLKRSRYKDLPIESAQDQEASASNLPERIMQYADLSRRIETLVSSLPPQCQKIFIMNRFEGKMAKEIALDLNLSTRTIEVQIAKALAVIKLGLKDYWLELLILVQSTFLSGHSWILT
ncbi:RNA polymerase sigma-70 factor [Dyadobacter sp. CY323]|uniref:RNA polymerase sigma-70 factor n=1 Tax=Dyadobacter sp. CY323 TaxID=2907302 RepID=UPI001F489933|nr:RNA polymerase sigma-70 factor [Dyadobacter sp. CY323]MCE6991406.1 RNA polymerase sigma-70 factor [Dyadobacter sp. CY323]